MTTSAASAAPGAVNPQPVMVLGATGVFGSRACRLLMRHGAHVIAVARNAERLAALAAETGVETATAELPAGLDALLTRHHPAVVIDTCGPFQQRDYAMPRACIAAGVPYIDISDAREDVAAIGTLDRSARAAGVAVIAGASSVPGLSSCVIAHLESRFARLEAAEIAITPGNDAPRGRAVIASILSYVGRPVPRWRDGGWTEVTGWQDSRRIVLGSLGKRTVAACDVPDLVLLPHRFPDLRSVSFHAGLELPLHHWGLWALSWPVRWGWLDRPERLTGLLLFLAERTRRFGSDSGGMLIALSGTGHDGRPRHVTWTLEAHGGDGPMVPVLPAVALALETLAGRPPEPGARPCLGELPLVAITDLFKGLAIQAMLVEENPPSLFRRMLGGTLDAVPPAIRDLHELSHTTTASGIGTVEHGDNTVARLAAALRLLPAEGETMPVAVTFAIAPAGETWRRSFNGRIETSRLTLAGANCIIERFGPLTVDMHVVAHAEGIDYVAGRNRLFGIPLPRWLGLKATGRERCDAAGRFSYDVAIELPGGLRLITYRGWLTLPGLAHPAGR